MGQLNSNQQEHQDGLLVDHAVQHPSFSKVSMLHVLSCESVVLRSHEEPMIRYKMIVPNYEACRAWAADLTLCYGDRHDPLETTGEHVSEQCCIDTSTLFLPVKYHYKYTEMCGSAGHLSVYYENYPTTLQAETSRRKQSLREGLSNGLGPYSQEQMWILLRAICQSVGSFHSRKQPIGLVHADHIYLKLGFDSNPTKSEYTIIEIGKYRMNRKTHKRKIVSVKVGTRNTYICTLQIQEVEAEPINFTRAKGKSLKRRIQLGEQRHYQMDQLEQFRKQSLRAGEILLEAASLKLIEQRVTSSPFLSSPIKQQHWLSNEGYEEIWRRLPESKYSQQLVAILRGLTARDTKVSCQDIDMLIKSSQAKNNNKPTLQEIELCLFKSYLSTQRSSPSNRKNATPVEEIEEVMAPITHRNTYRGSSQGSPRLRDHLFIDTDTNLQVSGDIMGMDPWDNTLKKNIQFTKSSYIDTKDQNRIDVGHFRQQRVDTPTFNTSQQFTFQPHYEAPAPIEYNAPNTNLKRMLFEIDQQLAASKSMFPGK